MRSIVDYFWPTKNFSTKIIVRSCPACQGKGASSFKMGNVEPAIIQTSTPEEVYEHRRICIEKGNKHPGGFVLSPGCEPPQVTAIQRMDDEESHQRLWLV
jgi:hypothetical protein